MITKATLCADINSPITKADIILRQFCPEQYPQRPIEHIHVKLQAPNGEVITTQLYFPEQPAEGLTVQLEDKGDYFLAIYNFVLP